MCRPIDDKFQVQFSVFVRASPGLLACTTLTQHLFEDLLLRIQTYGYASPALSRRPTLTPLIAEQNKEKWCPLRFALLKLQLIFDIFEDDDYHKVDVEVEVRLDPGSEKRMAAVYVW